MNFPKLKFAKKALGALALGWCMRPITAPARASVYCSNPSQCGLKLDPKLEGIQGIETSGTLTDAIVAWTNYALGFVGVIAVAFIVYGGFLNITAGGDEDQASRGRKIIVQAVVGIIIILSAYAIVNTFLDPS